jgi:P4 family phage/plasmid primase-like protien
MQISQALAPDGPLYAMAAYKQFILWMLAERNSKQVKLPVDHRTASVGDAHNADTWLDANTAIATAAAYGPEYGVGFVFTDNDPFFFADLDKCLEADGVTWSPVAVDIMARLPGAAIEVSQSGRGLHIFGQGTAPEHSCKNVPLGLEFYTEGRFVALTGTNAIGSADLDFSAHLPAVVSGYFPPKGSTKDITWTDTPAEGSTPPKNDDELIQRALTSGGAAAAFGGKAGFKELWEGNTQALAASYPDDEGEREYDGSSADAALAQHLAFWTGNNCERMLTLMRLSALIRDKWNREDYLVRTILRAASLQTSFYTVQKCQPTTINDSAIEEPKQILPLEKLKANPLLGMTGDQFSDAAIIMSATFDNRLVNLGGPLHYFTGAESQPADDQNVRRLVGRAMGAGDTKVTHSRITGTLSIIKDQAPALGEPDPANNSVFFTNGVVNIDSGELSPHKATNRNTRTLSVVYQPAATCPNFLAWLGDIFCNEPERVTLLQELIGWTLCRHTLGIDKAVLLIGPSRAGKGLILRLISQLHGRGFVPFCLAELDDNKRLSSMRRANVAIDSDATAPSSRNGRSVMGLFKRITSNEPIAIPQLYAQTPWEGSLNCKLFIAANSAPSMWDDSAATANRWISLVFDRSFLNNEDPKLFSQLAVELPGIAMWAFQGLQRLAARGRFELPQSSQDQNDALISDGGSIQDFIDARLVVESAQRCSDSNLWDCYRRWAINGGFEIGIRRRILKSLEDALRAKGVRRAKSIKMPDGSFHRGFYGVQAPYAAATNITPLQALPK